MPQLGKYNLQSNGTCIGGLPALTMGSGLTYTPGKFSNATVFPGTVSPNNYAYTSWSTPTKILSFSFWVYFGSFTNASIASTLKLSGNDGFSVTLINTPPYQLVFYAGTSGSNRFISLNLGQTPSLNIWYHMAFGYDPDNNWFYAYWNGTYVGHTTSLTFPVNTFVTNLCVGRWAVDYNDYYLNGRMQYLRVFDSVLSPGEVLEDYRLQFCHFNFSNFSEYTQNLMTNLSSSPFISIYNGYCYGTSQTYLQDTWATTDSWGLAYYSSDGLLVASEAASGGNLTATVTTANTTIGDAYFRVTRTFASFSNQTVNIKIRKHFATNSNYNLTLYGTINGVVDTVIGQVTCPNNDTDYYYSFNISGACTYLHVSASRFLSGGTTVWSVGDYFQIDYIEIGNNLQVVASEPINSDGCYVSRVSRREDGISQRDYAAISTINTSANQTVVLSFKYFGTQGTSLGFYQIATTSLYYYLQGDGTWSPGIISNGGTVLSIPVTQNSWNNISIKIVNQGTVDNPTSAWFILHSNSYIATFSSSEYWDFTDWQLENKDHPTPFINGTRQGVIIDPENLISITLDAQSPQWTPNGYYFNDNQKLTTSMSVNFVGNYSDTLNFWVTRSNSANSWPGIMMKDSSTDTTGWLIYTTTSTGAVTYKTNNSDRQICILPNDGKLHMVTMTWNNGTIQSYLDGVFVTSYTGVTATSGTGNVIIGLGDAYYKGYIDDIRFYGTILSSTDILRLYNIKASLTNNGKIETNNFIETQKYNPSLFDYSPWVLGNIAPHGMSWNGQAGENAITYSLNPVGQNDIMAATYWNDLITGGLNDEDGGFDVGGAVIPIDVTKKYRFSIWIRRENINFTGVSGVWYFGPPNSNGEVRVRNLAIEQITPTTAASGTGTVATLTFNNSTYTGWRVAPFMVGDSITVTGMTPSGYNGTWVVTACTTTTVSFNCTATGAQTVAGTISGYLVNPNPYFMTGTSLNDRWFFVVGYVFPQNYTGSNDPTSGYYVDGIWKGSFKDYKWSDVASTGLRSYNYYSTNPYQRQYFYRPRVDLCDGTEPTLQDLMSCRENPPILGYTFTGKDLARAGLGKMYLSTNMNITSDGKIYRTNIGGAWDEQAYSYHGFLGGAYLSFRVGTVNALADHQSYMMGLNTDPTTNASYTSLDYAWYINNGNTGSAIYENGAPSTYAHIEFNIGDKLSIWYDGLNINYYYNNALIKTTDNVGSGLTFYIDSSFSSNNPVSTNQVYDLIFSASPPENGLDKTGTFYSPELNEIGPVDGLIFSYTKIDNLSEYPDDTPLYLSNFSSGVDSWFVTGSDSIVKSSLVNTIIYTHASGGSAAFRTIPSISSKYFRAKVRYYSGTPLSYVLHVDYKKQSNGTYSGGFSKTITSDGLWNIIDGTFNSDAASPYFYLGTYNSADTYQLEIAYEYIGSGNYVSPLFDTSFNGQDSTTLIQIIPRYINNIPMLEFNGVSSSITLPSSLGYYLSKNSITSMSMWIKVLSYNSSTGNYIFSYPDGSNNNRFYITINSSTSILFNTNNGGSSIGVTTSIGELAHYVFIRDNINGLNIVYKNGALVNQLSVPIPIAYSLLPSYFGSLNGTSQYGNFQTGLIKIFNRVLNSQEILELANQKPTNMNIGTEFFESIEFIEN